MMDAIKHRYEFVILFDVENGNPNGDPEAENMPRIDPESTRGIVTDVCIKRKVRNFVELVKGDEPGYQILIKADRSLNEKFSRAYDARGLKRGQKGKNAQDVQEARDYMCENYFDVRTFGAVMSTGEDPCGIVRGPVQINFAKSVDPVYLQDMILTRQARTTDERLGQGDTELGRRGMIPYGLYRAEGYISAMQAQRVTGFNEDDLEVFWEALMNLFEHERSAKRGKMCVRKLYVFQHQSILGNCPAQQLFDRIHVRKKPGVVCPRAFSDYEVTADTMPAGVILMEKV